MAQAIIKKWGNSLSVRLPVAVTEAASLKIDDTVDIQVQDGRIVLIPVRAKEVSLQSLLASVTPENIHHEIDFGLPVGKEAL
ncbi:TPA: AbrB/MazE/SpoVT family DNA-binding domain-containing protein [Yersinia enterocolitica]|nr:AbrB/MazE/SpoVT family DNA-binding domain-containing protein [Yersinia enterocolitica]